MSVPLEYTVIAFAVFALVLVIVVEQYIGYRRKQASGSESSQNPADRAFNEIRIVEAGAAHMDRQGYDVSAARQLLQEAKTALERRDPNLALRKAESARSVLHAQRDQGGPPHLPSSAAPAPGGNVIGADLLPSRSRPVPAEEEAPAAPKIPAHQAESRFALAMLNQDIDSTAKSRGTEPAFQEATATRDQAQAAFNAGQFKEAFALALKGRRQLGGHIEAIGVSPKVQGSTVARDPSLSASPDGNAPAAIPCPQCGKPVPATDRFCRACGATTDVARCPRCRATLLPNDAFCGACGAPVTG
ncbi:MAG: zinc ribbon domain-containing protein [Thermoplasmata archaeon]|nr:zinc ribbon domain-containing protein [Thermoplasmata archaeon]